RASNYAGRQRKSQKIQRRSDVARVVLAELLLFDPERIDADLLKKTLPNAFLSLALFETLFDQFRIELRFSLNRFPLLYFPKTSLKRTSCRQCLPEFVAPDDMHKLKTRKSIS